MLILEKMPSSDFLLTDDESKKSIIMPLSIALELKEAAKTAGDLVGELYKLYGGNVKWRTILDNNLKQASGIHSWRGQALHCCIWNGSDKIIRCSKEMSKSKKEKDS